MKKIVKALSLMGLLIGSAPGLQAVAQADSKAGYIPREYRKFVDAFKCMRRSGFRKCSSGQKKRIVIAGLAAGALVVGTGGGAYVLLREKGIKDYAYLWQTSGDDVSFPVAFGQVGEKPTLTFDLDDVMSANHPSVSGFVRLFGKVSFRHPLGVMRLVPQASELKKQGENLSSQTSGASNIIETILKEKKEQGYGDLTDYRDEIIDCAVNPEPIEEMIEAVARLKKSGCRVIGATNQDYKIFQTYKAKMAQMGIPMEELFDWVLTTRADSVGVGDAQNYICVEDNVYMLVDSQVSKPNAQYYKTLREIEKNEFGGNSKQRFIHTDDRKENVDGAQAGIHFKLPKKDAAHSTKSEIRETFQNWKKDLEREGITFQ